MLNARGLPRAFAKTFVKDTAVADPRRVAPWTGPADPRSSGMPANKCIKCVPLLRSDA